MCTSGSAIRTARSSSASSLRCSSPSRTATAGRHGRLRRRATRGSSSPTPSIRGPITRTRCSTSRWSPDGSSWWWSCPSSCGRGVSRPPARAQVARDERERRLGEQRLGLAQELHDVLAHNISLINVQASVALHLMDEQPAQARAALTNIKAASRDALHELRAALDVLRRGEDAPRQPRAHARRPRQPGGRGSRRAGSTCDSTRTRGPWRLPAAVELAAYRIVQEALTNVTRHAQAHSVAVRRRVRRRGDGRGHRRRSWGRRCSARARERDRRHARAGSRARRDARRRPAAGRRVRRRRAPAGEPRRDLRRHRRRPGAGAGRLPGAARRAGRHHGRRRGGRRRRGGAAVAWSCVPTSC